MQLTLHYDMTYREVKYSNLGLEDIDRKMLMGINVTPIIGLLYTPVLIRCSPRDEHLETHLRVPRAASTLLFSSLIIDLLLGAILAVLISKRLARS